MTDLPSWASAAGAAALGFAGAWAALRVTVAGLKDDVAQLKSLVLMVNTIQAAQHAHEVELERIHETGHQNRNALFALSERVARIEAQGESKE